MIYHRFHHSLLFSLLVCCAVSSCAQAQDEEPEAAETPAAKVTAKPSAKARKRAQPKTFHVMAGAPKGGGGSAQHPFAAIQEAVDVAQGGDSIVVGAGTYDGSISINTAFPDDAPLTIRAAEGAQPVISGMKAVTGWKAGVNGVYTAEVEGQAKNLFSGAERLALASWPKIDADWIKVKSIEKTGNKLTFDSEALPEMTRATKIYAFSPARQLFEFKSFENREMEGNNGTLTFNDANFKEIPTGKYNKFTFFNSPSFITRPDEYAMEYQGTKTKFFFKPRSVEELAATQYRVGGSGISFASGAANIRVAGLVVTGMNGSAIGATKAKNITVEDCVFYNNDTGFSAKFITDLTIRRCLITQNYWGIGLFDADRVALEQCEVAFNDEDGIRISGRIFDKASKKLGASDIKLSQLYVHHHQYQGHPDNIQFFRGVGRTQFDKCLLMYGGQQMMMEQTQDMKIRDSVVLIGINRGLNLFSYDQPDASGWDLENNTIGYNRYNPVYIGGINNRSTANLFFNYAQPVSLARTGLKADYDWFAPEAGQKEFTFEKPKKGESAEKVEAYLNAGKGNPQLRNVPASMNVAFGGGSTPTRLMFQDDTSADFAVGDLIEINGDGVARQVQTVEGKAITFSPALPAAPFRYSNVLNWKNNSNFQIDTRPISDSPLLKAGPKGKAVGSSLDVAAYQKGDFDSDGKRDLPVVPRELAAMLHERPNRYIYPYSF